MCFFVCIERRYLLDCKFRGSFLTIFFINISAVSLRRVERPNIDTRINSHYLLGTQLTFDKIELLDALFDETGAVGSMEIVGDTVPGNGIVCVYVSILHVRVWNILTTCT